MRGNPKARFEPGCNRFITFLSGEGEALDELQAAQTPAGKRKCEASPGISQYFLLWAK